MSKQMSESETITKALKAQEFGDISRDGADWLNENLPETYQVSSSAVNYWVIGKHEPMDVTVRALQQFYKPDDPRHQLGADLAAIRIRKMEVAMRAHWAGGMK